MKIDSIYQNTPVDYLHCLYLGLFWHVVVQISTSIGSSQNANRINAIAEKRLRPLRRDGEVPRINLCGGIMNTMQLTGEEVVGMIWGLLALI